MIISGCGKKAGVLFFFLHEFILGWVVLELPLLLGDFFFRAYTTLEVKQVLTRFSCKDMPLQNEDPQLGNQSESFSGCILETLGVLPLS